MALVTIQRSPTPSSTSSQSVSEAESGEDDRRSQHRSLSENFFTVKGAALFLPRGNGTSSPRTGHRRSKHAVDLQQHLQAMLNTLRAEDNIKLAVRLESVCAERTRYMVMVYTNGRQDTEENIVLGMDFSNKDSNVCTIGLVLPLWSDAKIHLDGDGGFSVTTVIRTHIFKPVSVQAMWSALQCLHRTCEIARSYNYYPGSLFLTWIGYYESRINSSQNCVYEWNMMQDLQALRSDSPVLFPDQPTERARTEKLVRAKLREIMMQKDLENVTSKEIRNELEMQMSCNLKEFREFIDNEMIVILGQMDSASEVFEHVYLGSEWNASNLEELQDRGVGYILNVTREIDNFFPGLFVYHNIRVFDEEATDLLAYWNDTFKFISKAKKNGSKCLVHCKMGISRSASTVIAYAMKEYGWDLEHAFDFVKEKRQVAKPNSSFMRQLVEYQGILDASKQRHNKLWRSHSDSNLNDRLAKPGGAGLAAREQRASMTANGILSRAEEIRPQTMATDLNSLEESSVEPDTLVLNAQVDVDQSSEHTCRMCKRTSSVKLSDGAFNGLDSTGFLKDVESTEGNTSCYQLVSDESTSGDMANISTCQTSTSPHTTPHTSTSTSPPHTSTLGTPSPTASSFAANCPNDKIDFFSAREKFKELSQEWKDREKLPPRTDESTVQGRGATVQTSSNENTQESGNLRRPSTSIVTVDSNPGNANNNNNNTNHMSKDADCIVSSVMQPLSVKVLVTEMEVVKSQRFLTCSRCQSDVKSGPASQSANCSPDSTTVQDTANTPPPATPTIITSLSCCHALSLDASSSSFSSLNPTGRQRLSPDQLVTDEEACKNEKRYHFNELCDVLTLGAPIPEKVKKAGAFCKPRRSVSLCSDRSLRCGTVRRATLELEERLKEQEITCSSVCHHNSRSERPVEMEKRKNMEGTEAKFIDILGKGQRECVEPKVTTGEIKTENANEALTETAPLVRPRCCPLSSNIQESKLQNLSTESSNEDHFAQAAEKTKFGFFDTPLPSQRIEIIEYADIWSGQTSLHPDAMKEEPRHSEEKHGGTSSHMGSTSEGNAAATHPPFQHSPLQLEESAVLTKHSKELFGHLASSPSPVITKVVETEMQSTDPWAQSLTDIKEPASKLQVLGLVNNGNVDSLFKITTPSLIVPRLKDHDVECAKETVTGAATTVDRVRDKRTAVCSINPQLFCPAPYANMTGNSVVGGSGRPWTIGHVCTQVDDSLPVKHQVGLATGSCMKRSHTLAKLNSLESLLPNESPTIGAEAAETVFINQAGLLLTCVSGAHNAVCTNGPSSSPSSADGLSSLQTDHSGYAVHEQTEGDIRSLKEITRPMQHCSNSLQPIHRQHRKTHPLWRLRKTVEKKRTSSPQYNTV